MSEYVEWFVGVTDGAQQRADDLYSSPAGAVLSAETTHLTGFAPQDLQVALEEIEKIELWVLAQTDGVEPPEAVAEFHEFYFSNTYTVARESLTARAGTAASWEELSNSSEMAAYRAAVVADKRACAELQAMVDRTEAGESLAGMPWIPSDLQEVIVAKVGCDKFPEDPNQLFRPPGS